MKTFFRAAFAVLAIAVTAFATPSAAQQLPPEHCKIVWTHYTGWEPLDQIERTGILAKWGKKYNVNFELTLMNDYTESITLYSANQACAVAVTNMDALIGPASANVDSTFIVVGDYSDGNDGVLMQSARPASLQDLVGKRVLLVENTVSHYLLFRAFQLNQLPFDKVGVVNTSEGEIATTFAVGSEGTAIVTWNPFLLTAKQGKGAQLLFDSRKIPGEIIDGIIVHTGRSDNVKKALVGAWYEYMKIMQEPGPAREKAIELMAQGTGATKAEFLAQLKTTYMFFSPQAAAAFTEDSKLKETMDLVRRFSFSLGLFQDAKSVDHVGIQFPDGSTLGNPRNIKLRFNTTFTKMAADGKL